MTNELFKRTAGCNGIENYFALDKRLPFLWEKEHYHLSDLAIPSLSDWSMRPDPKSGELSGKL